MKSILLRSLTGLPKKIEKTTRAIKGRPTTEAVAFFDLVGSTQSKLTRGQSAGTEIAFRFTAAAHEIVTRCQGIVVKPLGDGLLCRFPDPLDACKAAMNLKTVSIDMGLLGRFALTVGRIGRYKNSSGVEDIFGDAVDRCSRIQSLAYPGQVLMDKTLFDVVRTHLLEFSDVIISMAFTSEVRSFGVIELYEVSPRKFGLIGKLMTQFHVHTEGRLSISEKIQFIDQAKSEVLELGTGLTAFAKYFTGQKPKEFRNPIADLLKRGVNVRCFAVDPDYEPARVYFTERDEEDYKRDLLRARSMILEQRKKFLAQGYPGQLQYFAYRHIPEFHCICVDGLDSENARMLFSPYLPGLTRAECPVYQLSRISNPELFEKYWAAISELQLHSTEMLG